MEKLTILHRSLYDCYRKVHFKDFFKLSEEDREKLCANERQAFNDHLNSENLEASNLIREKLNYRLRLREHVAQINNIKL